MPKILLVSAIVSMWCCVGCKADAGTTKDDSSSGDVMSDLAGADFGGAFSVTSSAPVQTCRTGFAPEFTPEDISATQNATDYTWDLGGSVLNGTIDASGAFSFLAPGESDTDPTCGDYTSSIFIDARFTSADAFSGTLRLAYDYTDDSCDCEVTFPIEGQRIVR